MCTRISGFTIVGASNNPSGRTGIDINVINGGSAAIDNNTITFDTSFPIGTGINVDVGSSAFILNIKRLESELTVPELVQAYLIIP